ncbi:MAG TPA: hypothetical protein VJT11_13280 [Nitrospiraceae bacterium]|nr:hypothetical protein [Nitrospiraceae bacterium]
MFPVDGLAGGGDDGGTDGGVAGGLGGGGVLTTGVEGCNKLVIAEFWSKFMADREPLEGDAEPLPAEATE